MTNQGLSVSLDLLSKVENAVIESAVLEWPEMTALLQQLNKLTREDSVSLSMSEDQCIRLIRTWIQRLADGPMPPTSPQTGFAEVTSALADAIKVNSAHTYLFKNIEQCLGVISNGPHPASTFLEDWISAQDIIEGIKGSPREGLPAIGLISKNAATKEAVLEWLGNENLFAEAEKYSTLKRSSAFETIVLFGPPNRYESSKWCNSPESDFKSQWLLTSPPAARVLVLSWPSHGRLNLPLVGPWQGFPPPTVIPINKSESSTALPVFEFIDTPVTHTSNFNFHDESEVISARQYEILGADQGLWVFFDDQIGPKPRVLSGDFSRTYNPSGTQALPLGTHLVFRSHDVERQHLTSASKVWWESKYREFSFDLAEKCRTDLKQNIQHFLDVNGLDELKRRFTSSGLTKEYSIQLHSRILVAEYVAPQISENYEAVCRSIDYRPPSGAFNLLSRLRTARQQAGLNLMRELLEMVQVAASKGRLDDLGDVGFVKFHDETLGDLFISTVTHVSDVRSAVPLSKLGRPLDRGGSIWLK